MMFLLFLLQDLQSYLDDAKDGVVYFSLGTNIPSSMLRKEIIDALIEGFKKLSPVKVLWKYEKDDLPGKPDNVKISKWLPQNDILGKSRNEFSAKSRSVVEGLIHLPRETLM